MKKCLSKEAVALYIVEECSVCGRQRKHKFDSYEELLDYAYYLARINSDTKTKGGIKYDKAGIY